MRQVVIDIDAGPTECGDCQLLKDRWKWKARCPIYGMTYTDVLKGQRVGHYPRLPACLSAEAKLKRLVEAARVLLDSYVYLINGGDARFLDPTKEDEVLAVRAALKEIEHE
jgi:hypothetical protein